MKKWIKSSRVLIGAFAIALVVTVYALMSAGDTSTAEASGPVGQLEHVEENSPQIVRFVGDIGPTTMGKKWSGAD
jgi:hypothetical protein